MARTWGRLYSGTRNHRKIKILRAECPGFWQAFYVLLELTFECDDEGQIYLTPDRPYTTKSLAKELGISPKNTEVFLKSLENLGILSRNSDGILRLISYSERQYESDISTVRTRKYREKQKEESLRERSQNVSGTFQERCRERFGNGPETETETETETEQTSKGVVGPAATSADSCPCPKPIFECEAFSITAELHGELCQKFPVLPPEQILAEYSDIRDWCLDNRLTPKHRKKFAADGRLREPRRFLKNWLAKETPQAGFLMAPPAKPLPPEPEDIMIPDPQCPVCRGGGLARDGPCQCLRLEKEVLAERKRHAEEHQGNITTH